MVGLFARARRRKKSIWDSPVRRSVAQLTRLLKGADIHFQLQQKCEVHSKRISEGIRRGKINGCVFSCVPSDSENESIESVMIERVKWLV